MLGTPAMSCHHGALSAKEKVRKYSLTTGKKEGGREGTFTLGLTLGRMRPPPLQAYLLGSAFMDVPALLLNICSHKLVTLDSRLLELGKG